MDGQWRNFHFYIFDCTKFILCNTIEQLYRIPLGAIWQYIALSFAAFHVITNFQGQDQISRIWL